VAQSKEDKAVYHRAYYLAHKGENGRRNRSNHLRIRYGITLADYDEMLENQGGGCAICGKTPAEEGRHLSVDHDHETGEVRGLLCVDCNRGLGCFRDNSNLCRFAAQYLNGG